MKKLYFENSDFCYSYTELVEVFGKEFADELKACHHRGQCESEVKAFIAKYGVDGDKETCRQYLKGYGAWDEVELSDHKANIERLVWLSAGALADNEDIYFSNY